MQRPPFWGGFRLVAVADRVLVRPARSAARSRRLRSRAERRGASSASTHDRLRVTFKRALGPFDATMVVIGGIIGSGIFINPYIVAGTAGQHARWCSRRGSRAARSRWPARSPTPNSGALFPRVGGQYAYLRDGLHPLAGFLYGWALLAVIESGAIAAVAIAFATYALRLIGRAGHPPAPLAIAALVVLSVDQLLRREARQPGAERAGGAQGRARSAS